MAKKRTTKTTLGTIHPDALAYTAGRDVELDRDLVDVDCLGTAAHVTMLSRAPMKPPLFTGPQRKQVVAALVEIMRAHRRGSFSIRLSDQDIHLAVERVLTRELGELGKRVHTGRSRNDQVALDLRLFGKTALLDLLETLASLVDTLLASARKYRTVPMVGRTHMQKAMPSSVGLWASAYAEGLLDDCALVLTAYELTDQNPLGSAAGYGVPLPIDRGMVTRLLGMGRTVHNVLHASNSRGKQESIVLQALAQVMVTLSRLSQDLILFSMPEFGYFKLPPDYATGSSIMPQKANPDVLELIRARAATVIGHSSTVLQLLRGSPSGYNRDVQETKEPYITGVATARSSVEILIPMVRGMAVDRGALEKAFTPEVFATDYALEQVAKGKSWRDAYHAVKSGIDSLENADATLAIARKHHEGATAGLDLDALKDRARETRKFAREERRAYHRAISALLGVPYPKGLEP